MNRAFADTFYFLALLNRRDAWHDRAAALSATPGLKIVTTTWILTEVADALSNPGRREVATALIRTLQADSDVIIVEASPHLFEQAVQLFEDRADKSWTLTDCTSFVVMRDLGVTVALTGDHHFAQAGFQPRFSG